MSPVIMLISYSMRSPLIGGHQTYIFQPFDQSRVIGYNPFRGVPSAQRPRVAQDIMELFKAIWGLDSGDGVEG